MPAGRRPAGPRARRRAWPRRVGLVRRLERQHDVRVYAGGGRTAATGRHQPGVAAGGRARHRTARRGRGGLVDGRWARVRCRPARARWRTCRRTASPVVVVVPSGSGYESVAARLAPLVEAGRVAAVLVEDDEAVLLANRLPGEVPVVDEVDAAAVLAAERVAVEVAGGGQPMRVLTDPLKLRAALGARRAGARRRGAAGPVALRRHQRRGHAGRARRATPTRRVRGGSRWPTAAGCRSSRATSWSGPVAVGEARRLRGAAGLRAGTRSTTCGRSTWPRSGRRSRPGSARPASGPSRLAALRSAAPYADPAAALADLLDVPVPLGRGGGPGRVGRGDVDPRGGCRVGGGRPRRRHDRHRLVGHGRGRRRGRGPADRGGRGAHRRHAGRRGVGQARAGVPRGGAAGAARRGRHPRLPGPSGADRRRRQAGRARARPGCCRSRGRWRRGSGARCASGSRSSWSAATSPAGCARWGRRRGRWSWWAGSAGDDEILAAVSGALPAARRSAAATSPAPSATATPSPTGWPSSLGPRDRRAGSASRCQADRSARVRTSPGGGGPPPGPSPGCCAASPASAR